MGAFGRSSEDSKSPSPAPKRVIMEEGDDRDDRRRDEADRRQRHMSGGSDKDRHDRDRDRDRDAHQDTREALEC